ncbi:hypothetical protein B0A55_10008 [Friedmanniomyces simplex]|uniref:Cytochrome c oxidase subunit 6, mitochondrial n=1 Tax=Friedmanniomyces simplex TaxID=329884 RepID=A0A4U0WSG2_9PEZI|nr:hypothetical protein B0A55_10008 [Friedmanniomyces simplex]
MSSVAFARIARARLCSTPVSRLRPALRVQSVQPVAVTSSFSTRSSGLRMADADAHDPHHEESFEEFTARYEKEFDQVQDVFELQRNLNNAFAYDLVPSTAVITAALRAARRVNDFPTAVRIFEGIRAKVENVHQYNEYLVELQGMREEMGVTLKEDLFPGTMDLYRTVNIGSSNTALFNDQDAARQQQSTPGVHINSAADTTNHPTARRRSLHFEREYLIINLLSSGDYGEAYSALPRTAADQYLASLEGNAKKVNPPVDKVVVAKFAKSDYTEGDLQAEIKLLTRTMKGKRHPLLMPALDWHMSWGVQWLAMPFLRGGDLGAFVKGYPKAVTSGFVWHVGYQLIQALAFFHFGVTDYESMVRDENWPHIYHADVYPINLLLRPQSTKGMYPDHVLADFGRAMELQSGDDVALCQLADYKDAANVLGKLRELAEEQDWALAEWIGCLNKMEEGPENVLPVLRAFVKAAGTKRKKLYKPMPENVAVFLADGENESLVQARGGYRTSQERAAGPRTI